MSRYGWMRLGVIVAFFASLEAVVRLGVVKRTTMIPPTEMARALVDILAGGQLNDDIVATLATVLVALVGAVTTGFAMGVLLHAMRPARRLLDPLFASYYAVPHFVFYPVFIVLFGMNRVPLVILGYLFAVVAMIINTLNGLDRIPRVLLKVARTNRMGPLATAWYVVLPSTAPYLFTGIKLAVAYSFIGVIAGEFILSGAGIGHQLAFAYDNFDSRTMYGLLLFILTLVTVVNMSLWSYEQKLLRRRSRG
ncbi:MAG: ABC transporter permease subunit [Alphaproteobacteria bacterium]|nr:ABC transporter permease subunit [Alphaproteobacteria bacterium]